jgi:hypothetical protein
VSTRHDDGAFARSTGSAVLRGAFLIALAVVIGVVLLAKGLGDDESVSAGPADETTTTVPPDTTPGAGTSETTGTSAPAEPGEARPVNEVAVLVANASGVPKAAGTMSEQLKAAGYTVREAANAKQQGAQATVVYYTPGYQKDAAKLATSIKANPTSVQALPNPPPVDDLRQANVLVLLGRDLAKPAG